MCWSSGVGFPERGPPSPLRESASVILVEKGYCGTNGLTATEVRKI
jgi:hypothetical protein